MRKFLTLLSALFLVATACEPAAFAQQKKSPLIGQPPIRHKLEMRRHRFEVAPQFVVSTNQDFRHFIGGGIALQFHVTDWLGIAASFAGGTGLDSGLTTRINEQLKNEGEMRPPFQPTKDQFNSHLATTKMLTAVYATLTPFSGKLAMFGALFLRYDLYGIAGVGFQDLTNTWGSFKGTKDDTSACKDPNAISDPNACDPSNAGWKVSGVFGIGLHLYFNEWLGLNLELRDFVNGTNPGGLDVNGDRKINSDDETAQNNLFFGVGLSFMLPISAKVSP